MKLDSKGRCCGRKPIDYKGGSWMSPAFPQKFCPRCVRSFDRDTDEQVANWAWCKCVKCYKTFVRISPEMKTLGEITCEVCKNQYDRKLWEGIKVLKWPNL